MNKLRNKGPKIEIGFDGHFSTARKALCPVNLTQKIGNHRFITFTSQPRALELEIHENIA